MNEWLSGEYFVLIFVITFVEGRCAAPNQRTFPFTRTVATRLACRVLKSIMVVSEYITTDKLSDYNISTCEQWASYREVTRRARKKESVFFIFAPRFRSNLHFVFRTFYVSALWGSDNGYYFRLPWITRVLVKVICWNLGHYFVYTWKEEEKNTLKLVISLYTAF